MKKILVLLSVVFLALPILSATCTTDNAFTQGDDINICTGACKYQNPADLTVQLDCDGNSSCFLTSYYSNDTLISSFQEMTWNGSTFNYSLGSINTTGTYTHELFCYNQYGEFKDTFTSSIATSSGSISETPSVAGYGSYSSSISYGSYVICSYVYDFINENYNSGKINYSTDQLTELTNKINNHQGSSLSSDTIVDYITNYNSKCGGFKELATSVQIGVLEEKILKVEEEPTFWDKWGYEMIFIIIVCLGIFTFEYLKKGRKKKFRQGRVSIK